MLDLVEVIQRYVVGCDGFRTDRDGRVLNRVVKVLRPIHNWESRFSVEM
jgi:hypothetical protein